MKRVTRDRYLTSEEAAKYNAIREQIEQEKPEIRARIEKQIAERIKKKALKSKSGRTVRKDAKIGTVRKRSK